MGKSVSGIKPAFDPNKPFEQVSDTSSENGKPAFDPNKPFEEVKKKSPSVATGLAVASGSADSEDSLSDFGYTPQETLAAITLGSSGNDPNKRDWSLLETAISEKNKKADQLRDAKNYKYQQAAGPGAVPANTEFQKRYEQEAQKDFQNAENNFKSVNGKYQYELSQPIHNMIQSGEYKDYFDQVGNFKADKAIDHFDKLVKENKAGNYTRDMMVAMLKNAGSYQLDEPQRKKLREAQYKKEGIDIDKYGKDIFDKIATKPLNNLDLLKQETSKQAQGLMEQIKPLAIKAGADYTTKFNELKASVDAGQLSEEDAAKQIADANKKYQQSLDQLDKQYQAGVRNINVKAQDKYSKINTEIQNIGRTITDDVFWKSLPTDVQQKITVANNKVERELGRQKNLLRQGLDILGDVRGFMPHESLFGKSIISGWYGGLANLGNYLSEKGYDNSFSRYLQGKQYDADVAAPAEYQWGENPVRRALASTGTSLGASAPIMIPSVAVSIGTGGAGLPAIVGTLATGLTAYYGEKAQNTGEVYKQILEQTGDPTRAYMGAQQFEDDQKITAPLYFLEAAGIHNLLKGGSFKKYLIGQAQELGQELPTEYWQNYTQAQQVDGYDKGFGSYIKEHPETTLDVITSTIGQSGALSAGGKFFNSINAMIPQSKTQLYADMIGKHGIDFAMENLKQQYNAGVLDEKEFEAEGQKIMIAGKKMSEFDGLGLKGEDAKAYFTLSEQANQLNNAIKNTEDEGLKIVYEKNLDEAKRQLEEITKGKGAYAVLTMPGGGNQTKVIPLSDLQRLEQDGKLNELIYQVDNIEVRGDEILNEKLQNRKYQLGNPEAPEGFYTNNINKIKNEKTKTIQAEGLREVESQGAEESAPLMDKNQIIEAAVPAIQSAIENGEIKGQQAVVAQMVADINESDETEKYLKEISDQALNNVAPGAKTEEADSYKAAIDNYSEPVVKLATQLFPITNKTEQNASTVRSNREEISEGGEIGEGGQNTGGEDLQLNEEREAINAGTEQQAGEEIASPESDDKINNIERQRAEAIKVASKPEIDLNFIDENKIPKEISEDLTYQGKKVGSEKVGRTELIKRQKNIKDKFNDLKELLNCLHF